MRRDFLLGIGLLASVAAGGGSAVAADMPVRPPPPLASPVYVPDWVGFYVGIHGGGGSAHTSFDQQFSATGVTVVTSPFANDLTPSASGGIFGGQVGYN